MIFAATEKGKKKMPRYIDADLFKLQIERGAEMTERGIRLLDLSQQPEVDAVLVVRCKDCEAYQPTEGGKPFCVVHERATFADGFCSEAEAALKEQEAQK